METGNYIKCSFVQCDVMSSGWKALGKAARLLNGKLTIIMAQEGAKWIAHRAMVWLVMSHKDKMQKCRSKIHCLAWQNSVAKRKWLQQK